MTGRISVLRFVSLFAEIPDDVLADASDLLQEVLYAAGEDIFVQGDPGDALYIVAEGQVRVHSGGRTLSIMERGNVFGEMAVLDPEPRSATVTALEATCLLRLDRETLYRLMDQRSEVAHSVIRTLCRYLRARTTSMVEDHHYLQQVAHLTAAAAAVEAGVYEPESIEEVTQRADSLGQMARIFQSMIRQVYAREQRLKQELQQLRVEIDRAKTADQVAEITETDYFRQLQEKARKLRTQTNRSQT
jgi:CRP-like cAMP-binding protein